MPVLNIRLTDLDLKLYRAGPGRPRVGTVLRWLHRGHRSLKLIAEPARARLRARIYRLRHALTPYHRAPRHPLRRDHAGHHGPLALRVPIRILLATARHPRGIALVAAGCASTAVAAVVATLHPPHTELSSEQRVTLTRATLIEHGVSLHTLLSSERTSPFMDLALADPGHMGDGLAMADPGAAQLDGPSNASAFSPAAYWDFLGSEPAHDPIPPAIHWGFLDTPVGTPAGPPLAMASVAPDHFQLPDSMDSMPQLDDLDTLKEQGHLRLFFPEPPPSTWEADIAPGVEAYDPEATRTPSISREDIRVEAGDSLARILRRAGYDHQIVNRLMASGDEAQRLTRLHPGQRLTLLRDDEGRLVGLDFPFARDRKLRIQRLPDDSAFQAEVTDRHMERRLVRAEGEIRHSLYAAARSAGLSDRLIMELTNIFGWEVDLARDLRPGNRFHVLYEVIDNGEDTPITGNILAASLETRDRGIAAIRFSDSDGRTDYYTPDGNSLRREFKRHPVSYSRISSRFDRNRLHPVLGVRRPHLGVDYAAPTGTPIRAAGDGRIVRRAWRGGYGRVVEIQHGSRYRTLYAHMSDYAPGMEQGDYVRRGQIIGYVGRSGMATGPHLHYEFIVNGRHQDPLKVDLPQASPLPGEHMEAFRQHAAPLLSALHDDAAPTQLALYDDNR